MQFSNKIKSNSDQAIQWNIVPLLSEHAITNCFVFRFPTSFPFRSRMNCVIERRRAEELVDNAPKMTPFGFNFNSEPKKRVTGERMAIFCESGNAIK